MHLDSLIVPLNPRSQTLNLRRKQGSGSLPLKRPQILFLDLCGLQKLFTSFFSLLLLKSHLPKLGEKVTKEIPTASARKSVPTPARVFPIDPSNSQKLLNFGVLVEQPSSWLHRLSRRSQQTEPRGEGTRPTWERRETERAISSSSTSCSTWLKPVSAKYHPHIAWILRFNVSTSQGSERSQLTLRHRKNTLDAGWVVNRDLDLGLLQNGFY
jgi:hypothetical protein